MAEKDNEGSEFVRRTPGTKEAVERLMTKLGASERSEAIRDACFGAAVLFEDGTPEEQDRFAAFIGIGRRRFRAGSGQ